MKTWIKITLLLIALVIVTRMFPVTCETDMQCYEQCLEKGEGNCANILGEPK